MWNRFLAGAALGVLLPLTPALAAQLEQLKNTEGGVAIAVTPINVNENAKVWEFRVALDTHSGSLGDDLSDAAVLVDDQNREYKPVAWEGPGAGGHHRAGVLRFNAIDPMPAAVELRIRREGEPNPRTFRWGLK
jgi:hypothetical protein